MEYNDAREYINSLVPRGIVPGLTAVTRLLAMLGDPQDRLRIIHIAGTNGKGSAGAFISSILRSADNTVCRFATPAVGDYLETFSVNAAPITEKLYSSAAERVKAAITQLEKENIFPTSFEAECAIAFLAFSELMPDYALIECGMGGLLDATNAIKKPALSVITSISRDHTRFLGDTITEIAKNKAGIIKDGTPVISVRQSEAAEDVIQQTANEHGSPLYIADEPADITYNSDHTEFICGGERYSIKLLGTYQPHNAALAITAAKALGISETDIKQGLSVTVWPYRFERIGRYILDGAHNEDAARELAASLEKYTSPDETAFICGCFRDKDYAEIAAITAPYASAVYCITAPTERGLGCEILCDTFSRCGISAFASGTMAEAIKEAGSRNYKNIIIFGSLSILHEARKLIEGT